MGLSGARILF